jgi:zinc protease
MPTVVTSVWYRVGSSDERVDRTGFAHLFEHLFKSPASQLGAHHYEVLKRAGASDANASTGTDRTAYYEVVPAHQLELALWIESGRMGYFATGMEEQRLITQQSVVRAERRRAGRPCGAVALPSHALYRRSSAPPPDDRPALTAFQAATLDGVIAFYRVVRASERDARDRHVPANLDALVDRYFGSFPRSRRPDRQVPPPITTVAMVDQVQDKFATLPRIHRAWLGPRTGAADEAELDVLVAAWASVGTGALWKRLVYETSLAQRVAAWTTNTRLGGEVHISVDLRPGSDPAAVRAILDEECQRGVDARAIDRAVTRREAGVIWGLSGLSRRVSMLQRSMLYRDQPDSLADDLARYRAVTPASIDHAIAGWLSTHVEIETVPVARAMAS